jgi:excisionase family DNA binding protein
MPTTEAPEFLSTQGLADRYDVPVQTVYAWLYKGTAPPSLKIGRHRRFRLSDVLAWEEERTSEGAADVATA